MLRFTNGRHWNDKRVSYKKSFEQEDFEKRLFEQWGYRWNKCVHSEGGRFREEHHRFREERRILPRSSSPRVFSFSKTVFRKLLLSNGRNDDIVSSVESIHGNSIYREKGINDTKFKQTRRWCVFIRMEIWSILSREERNDNIVPSIVFGQVNNPLSTIEHWMTGPNIPRLTTYFVG